MSNKYVYALLGAFAGFLVGAILSSIVAPHSGFTFLHLACIVFGALLAYFKMPVFETEEPIDYPPRPQFFKNKGSSHGTANWENPEYIGMLFNDGDWSGYIEGDGYYIGEGYNVFKLMHAVCLAGSGQGKGVSLILPNLLKTPSASWFVLDPKGENCRISGRWQKEAGQNVVLLDPWNEQKRQKATHGIEPVSFNPLHFAKGNPDEMPESCGVIAEMIVPESSHSKDSYWESRARSLIKTYLLHMLTARPAEEQNLGTLYRWLRLPTAERQTLWLEMYNNVACDEIVKSGIGEFIGLSEESGPLPSIISTAQDNTGFLESEALRASLTDNGFDPYSLTDGKTTVYLCLPERFLNTHSRWLRLVVGICLKACNYRPGKRVNFVLDEFAILGKMTAVEQAFAFARGQNVSVWIFAQSLTQLIGIYGEHGANAFLSNARLRQFFGVYDLATQKYLSEYLGDTTIQTMTQSQSQTTGTSSGSSSGHSPGGGTSGSSSGNNHSATNTTNKQAIARKLLTPEEIGKEESIITLIDGYKFRLARLPYWDSLFKAYEEKRFRYYPLTDEVWHMFINRLKRDKPEDRIDLMTVFLPRADQPVKNG